jgi:hypothetical protein
MPLSSSLMASTTTTRASVDATCASTAWITAGWTSASNFLSAAGSEKTMAPRASRSMLPLGVRISGPKAATTG